MSKYKYLIIVVCGIVSLALNINLWMNQKGSLLKKISWTVVNFIPLVGWVFYGGCYNPPGENPIKAKGGASGWESDLK